MRPIPFLTLVASSACGISLQVALPHDASTTDVRSDAQPATPGEVIVQVEEPAPALPVIAASGGTILAVWQNGLARRFDESGEPLDGAPFEVVPGSAERVSEQRDRLSEIQISAEAGIFGVAWREGRDLGFRTVEPSARGSAGLGAAILRRDIGDRWSFALIANRGPVGGYQVLLARDTDPQLIAAVAPLHAPAFEAPLSSPLVLVARSTRTHRVVCAGDGGDTPGLRLTIDQGIDEDGRRLSPRDVRVAASGGAFSIPMAMVPIDDDHVRVAWGEVRSRNDGLLPSGDVTTFAATLDLPSGTLGPRVELGRGQTLAGTRDRFAHLRLSLGAFTHARGVDTFVPAYAEAMRVTMLDGERRIDLPTGPTVRRSYGSSNIVSVNGRALGFFRFYEGDPTNANHLRDWVELLELVPTGPGVTAHVSRNEHFSGLPAFLPAYQAHLACSDSHCFVLWNASSLTHVTRVDRATGETNDIARFEGSTSPAAIAGTHDGEVLLLVARELVSPAAYRGVELRLIDDARGDRSVGTIDLAGTIDVLDMRFGVSGAWDGDGYVVALAPQNPNGGPSLEESGALVRVARDGGLSPITVTLPSGRRFQAYGVTRGQSGTVIAGATANVPPNTTSVHPSETWVADLPRGATAAAGRFFTRFELAASRPAFSADGGRTFAIVDRRRSSNVTAETETGNEIWWIAPGDSSATRDRISTWGSFAGDAYDGTLALVTGERQLMDLSEPLMLAYSDLGRTSSTRTLVHANSRVLEVHLDDGAAVVLHQPPAAALRLSFVPRTID